MGAFPRTPESASRYRTCNDIEVGCTYIQGRSLREVCLPPVAPAVPRMGLFFFSLILGVRSFILDNRNPTYYDEEVVEYRVGQSVTFWHSTARGRNGGGYRWGRIAKVTPTRVLIEYVTKAEAERARRENRTPWRSKVWRPKANINQGR